MSAQFDPTPHYALKSPPEKLLKAAKIAVAIGVICFAAGLLIDGYGKRIRVAYLTNLVYFIGLSLGGLIFACTLTLTLALALVGCYLRLWILRPRSRRTATKG